MASDDKSTSADLPIPARIRRRREDRKMTGAELARRVGVSPAYISLIETGAKVPRVRKAAEIALALDDDPAVYRAWALASREDDAGQSLADLERGAYWASDRELRKRFRSGEDLTIMRAAIVSAEPGPAAAEAVVRSSASTSVASHLPRDLERERIVDVPVVGAGVDPGDGLEVPEHLVVDRMLLDSRLVRGKRLVRPFAFRASRATTERLRGEARPDDWVVVSSSVGDLTPETVYAVRLRQKLILSKVVHKGDTLLLQSGEGQLDIEVIELGDEGVGPHIAGRVALVVRRGE